MRLGYKLVLAAALGLLPTCAFAQAYPSKPIKFIVGFPAGSSIDVVSRIVTDDIRERTGATIVIENRPGALGALGLEAVSKAAPDGYTLMPSSSATHSSGPHLLRALQQLEPATALSHLGQVTRFDVAVVSNSSGPYTSAQALIAAAKEKPDMLTYGYGSGTGQVGAAAFSQAAGIRVRPIPYKGQPAAITDLLGGRIDFVASDLGAMLAFLQQGSLKPLALMSERRSSILPDVPTAGELGLSNAGLSGWVGIDGPAKLPAEVTQWWEDQLKKSLSAAPVQEKFRNLGMETTPMFGEAFASFIAKEFDRWGAHVRAAGIQAE